MWPGFGDNMRVLEWIVKRVAGQVSSQSTALGDMPLVDDFNLDEIDFDSSDLSELLAVDTQAWKTELEDVKQYLDGFGGRVPAQLYQQLDHIKNRLV